MSPSATDTSRGRALPGYQNAGRAIGAAPAIDALGGVLDGTEVTTIITAPVVLSVIRSLELNVRPPSAIPALTGTWNGQPEPVVLALAHRR